MNEAKIRLRSRVLFMNTEFMVLLPEKPAEDGEKFKVLWLLHGAGNDYTEFLYGTPLTQYLNGHRTIAVMPSGLNSDYGHYPDFGGGYDFPKFFFEELMPFIYASFPASEAREDNFLAGISMGGYGALELGLMHPEKFAGIAAIGAGMREAEYLDDYSHMTGEEFRKFAMANPTLFRTDYGAPGAIKPKEINVIAKYPTVRDFQNSPECMYRRFPERLREGNLPPMYFLVGTEDLFCVSVKRFEELAGSLGADNVTFMYYEGYRHEPALWDIALERVIELFGV